MHDDQRIVILNSLCIEQALARVGKAELISGSNPGDSDAWGQVFHA